MDKLIFDRTLEDITNDTAKGQYNAVDLNRVEQWSQYIYNELKTYNYATKVLTFKTNWIRTDFPTESEIERIKNNLKYLKEVYNYVTEYVPSSLDLMTYTKANMIERLLFYLQKIIQGMENRFVHCGVARIGQNRNWQHRWRNKYEAVTTKAWNELDIERWNEFEDLTEWRSIEYVIAD